MLTPEAIERLAQAESIRAAAETARGLDEESNGLIALPNNWTVHDRESELPYRRRLRGIMRTSALRDFAGYVETNKEPGATVFVDSDSMKAVAVLNMGDPESPGHCDNLACYEPPKTAAYQALLGIAGSDNSAFLQQRVAEFLEDWRNAIACLGPEADAVIETRYAIDAVRRITIEAIQRVQSTKEQLSESRSALESVTAKGDLDNLPSFIEFRCVPHLEMRERVFVLRLGVRTGGRDPMITLRIIKREEHIEQMAAELAAKVREELNGLPVVAGTYEVGA